MIKKNLWRAVVSSLLILLPMGYGLLTWDSLPATMPIHFQLNGTADGTAGKSVLVFLIPLLLLGIHWLCLGITVWDEKRHPQKSQKATRIIFWILPILSLAVQGSIYGLALGKEFSVTLLLPMLLGLLFVIIGNVMPKITQNRTFGIKISWTLRNEENWNKTHRFAGKLWVACGFAALATVFLPINRILIGMLVITAVAVVAPFLYSYDIYRRHRQAGILYPPLQESKAAQWITAILLPLILVGTAVLMLTGNVTVTCGEDAFAVDSIYCQTVEIAYEAVDSLEYRETAPDGHRTYGFGSARLLLGSFRNEEFGDYSRYTYTGNRPCIVMLVDGKVLVLGGQDADETKEIYNTLLQHGVGQ